MTEEELKALFSDMLSKDIEPMLCDTRVPLYDSPVPCGEPTYCPEDIKESVLLPRELLSIHPEFMIPVKGDSMKDAGIVAGDIVKVEADVTPYDGDIVLACIDGAYTLKTYFEDEEGQHWLVPQNEKYEPILLEERQNVRIFGRVKEVVKQTPRIASRLCMKIINRARQLRMKKQEISQERVSSIIKQMAPKVKIGRQWYAVYKPMEEKMVFAKEDYSGFCERVAKEVPEHKHLPTVVELQRMAVQSFKKPVRLWNAKDAPVQGKRFTAYEQIGLQTLGMLETDE
jgi:hypothetical protein